MKPYSLARACLLLSVVALPGMARAQAAPPPALSPARGAEAYYQFLLGRHLESKGDVEEAIKAHRRAAAADPSSAEILAELAALYARQDRAREAIETAEAAIRLDARNTEANRILGFVYASMARTDDLSARQDADLSAYAAKAVTHLELARRTDRVIDSGLEITLGRCYIRSGSLDKAQAVLARVVREEPERGEAVALLVEVYEAAGRLAEAIAVLESVAREQPAFLPSLAQLYERAERWNEAAEAYERALPGNPRSLELKTRLAVALLASGADAGAARALELARQVRQERPGDARLLRLEAEALRQGGHVPEALRLLESGVASTPDDPVAHLALAEAHASSGRFDEALRVLQQAAARFPSDLSVVFQEGAVLERQKRYQEAEQRFRQVIARDPLHAPALNYLGYMLADRGERLEESIEYIKRALQVEPDNGAYIDSLGWAYFKADRLDLAEANLRRAADKRVRDSAVQDHLGELLFRLGRYQEAVAAWQRALDGDGEQIDRAAVERKLRAARERGEKEKGRR